MTDAVDVAQKRHYMIFRRIRNGHSYIDFVYAETSLAAIRQYLQSECGVKFQADGSIVEEYDDQVLSYLHPLAYIEAYEKQHHEWQIRKLPGWILNVTYTEGVCGDDWSCISAYMEECRPHLHKLFPRSRAKGFLWRLKNGKTLVTYYRKISNFEIKVFARFTYAWDGKTLSIEQYTGTYDDILDSLDLDPGGRQEDVTGV